MGVGSQIETKTTVVVEILFVRSEVQLRFTRFSASLMIAKTDPFDQMPSMN